MGTLGANIRRLRIAGGHTNAARFARLAGITPGRLSDWEAGRYSKLRLDNLMRLAKHIPCAVEALLVGIDQEYEDVIGVLLAEPGKNPSSSALTLLRGTPANTYKDNSRLSSSEPAPTPGAALFPQGGDPHASTSPRAPAPRPPRSRAALSAGIVNAGLEMQAEGERLAARGAELVARGAELVAMGKAVLHREARMATNEEPDTGEDRARFHR